jgi:hypothetical protein
LSTVVAVVLSPPQRESEDVLIRELLRLLKNEEAVVVSTTRQ